MTSPVSIPPFFVYHSCVVKTTYVYSSRVSFIFHISVYILFRSIIFFLSFYFLWNPSIHAWMLLSQWWIAPFTFLSGNKNTKQNKTRITCKLQNGKKEEGRQDFCVLSKRRGRWPLFKKKSNWIKVFSCIWILP